MTPGSSAACTGRPPRPGPSRAGRSSASSRARLWLRWFVAQAEAYTSSSSSSASAREAREAVVDEAPALVGGRARARGSSWRSRRRSPSGSCGRPGCARRAASELNGRPVAFTPSLRARLLRPERLGRPARTRTASATLMIVNRRRRRRRRTGCRRSPATQIPKSAGRHARERRVHVRRRSSSSRGSARAPRRRAAARRSRGGSVPGRDERRPAPSSMRCRDILRTARRPGRAGPRRRRTARAAAARASSSRRSGSRRAPSPSGWRASRPA